MRGLETSVRKLRRKVFVEIARVAFHGGAVKDELEAIPYKITPTEKPQYRESVYRERAIASERVRFAMGMSLRPQNRPVHVTSGLEASNIASGYYEPPLVQVIPSACEKCEDNVYEVSNQCRRCLARSCVTVCPTNAVFIREDGYAEIDRAKCIKCGRCKSVCPYDAIGHKVRPCSRVCGVDAVETDELGRAKVNPEKCVACGQCMVNCPFGAIADKSQIFQLVRALIEGEEIAAEVAPAIVGQFGEGVTLGKIKAALKKLGFIAVYEVAHGADLSAMEEAKKYAEEVATGKEPFLLTSCCPSWSMLAKTRFPDMLDRVSSTLTPMVMTARAIKSERPNAKVVFIGPCPAKKLEAMRRSVKSDVDFVLTFEELSGIFEAAEIEPEACEEDSIDEATALGRGYAVAGGVAGAVERCVKEFYPQTEVKVEHAEGLFECRKLLILAEHGKKNGCLLEGMACPGGCVAGAGVNLPVQKGASEVRRFAENSKRRIPKQKK